MAINKLATKKYSIITRSTELFPVLLIYFKIKKLPTRAAKVQNVPQQILYPISNSPEKIKTNEEAIAVTIIKKLLVEIDSLGSIPKE